MQSAEGLRPSCSRSQIDVVVPLRQLFSGLCAHFAPQLPLDMCQAVLTQHDMIKSIWIFERSWTRWHRFFHICNS